MKILNILTTGLCMDGITKVVLNYYKNIDNNIQMDFVTPYVVEEIKRQIEPKKGKIYILKDRNKKPIKYIKELSRLIENNKYDIVQANGSSGILCLEMIAAKKAGCKTRIAYSHNTKADHIMLDKILRPILYNTYTNGFSCGEEAGKWLFKGRKFEIINNATELEKYRFNDKIRELYRHKYNLKDKIILGHVGTFNEQKNHDFLIDFFYKLSKSNDKYFLILIGEGTKKEEIKTKVRILGLEDSVLFVGNSNKVEDWLQAMDIMVFPSKHEGFPNVLVESQIAGLPCIISDRITNKVKLTDLVQFISIDQGIDNWINAIEKINIDEKNRIKNQPVILDKIKEQGFDIREEAKKLEEKYIKLLTKNK